MVGQWDRARLVDRAASYSAPGRDTGPTMSSTSNETRDDPTPPATGLPGHNAIFVMSGSGWCVHANSLDIQDRCSACWFLLALGGPTFWKLESPDELSCSSPPRIAHAPVHISAESFNRFTPAFKTAGDTSSVPALVLLITKDFLWNWVLLLQNYLPFHLQCHLNMPNRNRTSFPRSAQM